MSLWPDKMTLHAWFGPCAVVWMPLV